MKKWILKAYFRNGNIITRVFRDYNKARKEYISYWISDIFKVTLQQI